MVALPPIRSFSKRFQMTSSTKEIPEHCVTNTVVRVRFCDTDMMGVVHHSNYIKYFELARIEYLRRRGLKYSDWVKLGIHLPVIGVNVEYKKPAHLDELLTIETRLSLASRIKVGFDFRVLRVEGEESVLLAKGHVLLACVGDNHLPLRMPKEAIEVLFSEESAPADAVLL